MNELDITFVFAAAIVGVLLSLFYFGGLWFTVNRIKSVKWPGFLIGMSFLLRMILLMTVFYFILSYHWMYLLFALITFLITRQFLLHRIPNKEITLNN